MFRVYLGVLNVILILLIVRTDTSHRNSIIYQARQIGVLQLPHKNVKFDWNDKCQISFEKLKAMLTEASVLTQLESGKDYVIYSDASHNGLGYILMQEGKVVVYAFR